MRSIFHISVGSDNWNPTEAELAGIVRKFKELEAKQGPRQTLPDTRKIIHISVGAEDWTPTADELLAIVEQFQCADLDPLGGWIATRRGVNVTDIETAAQPTLVVNGTTYESAARASLRQDSIDRLEAIRENLRAFKLSTLDVDTLINRLSTYQL
ncbi:portal protein [Burkholderia phage BcepSaruman]|uniref:Uncharacterized protein n=1 Tax=Burkholderia phage BcepSaruman TaxID=2530032 RepID=A0A4D5ZGI9_9CAUD|nr:portal protein [Burkholderia phage BcepSaruman]QBX06622.1 hypothetical protein BcepSaruman_209 [Burkholderia phage BcepSaruman]